MSGMKSWSTTPANNVLANTGFTMDEGQAPSTVNDSVRQLMADVRTEWAQGANIASAATVDLSTATGGYVHITGTVTITAFGTVSAGIRRKITFDGALTLTHNGTSLILPTGANITTVAGDTCEAMSEGSGNWRVLWYAGKNVQATTVTASTSVVTPLVDSGTTASLLLRTNSGSTQAKIVSVGDGTNFLGIQGAATTFGPAVFSNGTDTNINLEIVSKGSGTISLSTGAGFSGDINNARTNQFQVLHTASASRNITVTGSNGGNPTISTTAGSLAITPNIVQAGGISGAGNIATTGSASWGTGTANFGTITKRKTADESVTSSTVLQNDDHLTFAIAASEEWVGVIEVHAGDAMGSMGVKTSITVPSGASMIATVGSMNATIASSITTSGTAMLSPTTDPVNLVRIIFWVLNGATPGSVTLQWAQNSSNGAALTFKKGSFLQATRIA